MNRNLKVSKSIEVNSNAKKVWDALTNPGKIKVYLFGTETITDWQIGSPIIFQGEYEVHKSLREALLSATLYPQKAYPQCRFLMYPFITVLLLEY